MSARITGIVFNDLNHDGMRDLGEPGIPAVIVVLENTLSECINTQTDSSGEYSFENITIAGEYTLYETVVSPKDMCPPSVFQQPTGFIGSTTRRKITLSITNDNINNDDDISGNDFGHDIVEVFGCQSFAWQIANGELIRIDLATGTFENLGFTNPVSTNLNGFGYNAADGNLYGYNINTNRVFRLSYDKILVDLPAVPNLPANSYFSGDTDMNGYLYIGRGRETIFYVVDVNPNRATYGFLVNPQNGFQEDEPPYGLTITGGINSADLSFNPQDGNIYSAGGDGIVRRINPITGITTELSTSSLITGTFGGQFFDNYSHLYSIRNSDGTVRQYTISGNSATVEDFSNSVSSSQNDGGRCSTAPIIFATFELNFGKSATPIVGVDDTITYTIILDNIGNTTANNFTLIDTIPDGARFINNSLSYNGVTIPTTPNPPGVLLGDVAVGVNTVTFQVVVETIPTVNPIPNRAYGSYTFVDTLGGETYHGDVITNIATTTIVEGIIHSFKSVNKAFAKVGDILSYTVVLSNTGNTSATSIFFIDTIPEGTVFISNSLFQDGTQISGSPGFPGVTLPNDIGGRTSSLITFDVIVVDTVPSPNPIQNNSSATFKYTGNPDVPTIKSGNTNSNTVETRINNASLADIIKITDKKYAFVGDTLSYTISIRNIGSTTAENILFIDTIPNDTSFVENSVFVNGVNIPGENVNPPGISLLPIGVGDVTTVTFQIVIDRIPNPNPIPNTGNVAYTFLIDPIQDTIGNGGESSNEVFTKVNTAILDSEKLVDIVSGFINDTLTYTISIENTGNITAENIVFVDTIPGGTTFIMNSIFVNGINRVGENVASPGISIPNLSIGEVTTITFKVVANSVPSPNPIVNIGNAFYNYLVDPTLNIRNTDKSNTNSVSTFINENINPIKVADNEYATIGDTLTYTIIWSNTLNQEQLNVIFIDTIPDGMSFISDSLTIDGVIIPGATISPPNPLSYGTLLEGRTTVVTFKVKVEDIPSPNPIGNVATVVYDFIRNPSTKDIVHKSGAGDVEVQINRAELNLFKEVDKIFADISDTLTYTIVFENTGNVSADGILFVDNIQEDIDFIENSLTINGQRILGANPNLGVSIPFIDPNSRTTVTFQVITETIPSLNPIENFGEVNWKYTVDPSVPNGNAGTKVSNIVDTKINSSDLEIHKEVDLSIAGIGYTLTYTAVLTNIGNVNARNVIFNDSIPNGTIFIRDSVTINGEVKVGENPELGVSIPDIVPQNVVTVTFKVNVDTFPFPNPIENSADVSWEYNINPFFRAFTREERTSNTRERTSNVVDTLIRRASLNNIVKLVDKEFADCGDTLTYTIILSNTGNTTALNVVVADTVPNGTTFIPGSLTINNANTNYEPNNIIVGSIGENETVTITFRVITDC